jgi:hypothetical protein
LCGKGDCQNQRNAVEAQRVERDGKSSTHLGGLKRKIELVGRMMEIGCD